MTILVWILAVLAAGGTGAQVLAALRLWRHCSTAAALPHERPALSLLMPLKGVAPGLEQRLEALAGETGSDDQLIFAMETPADPAHGVVHAFRAAHPDRDIELVISGPAGASMGKQHNLAAALTRARHEVIAFLDDDVEPDAANLAEAAHMALQPGTGAAFAVPYYAPGAPLGGALVAAYTNYGFAPNMGSLALGGAPRFIIGGFWATTRRALGSIGGLEPFARTVSDDAAIGQAFSAAGLTNRVLRHTVRLAPEQLDFAGGTRHLLKWLTLLRAEGIGTFLAVALVWNSLALAVAAAVVAYFSASAAFDTVNLVARIVIITRIGVVLGLNHGAYRSLRLADHLPAMLLYEGFIAPWLFLAAAFRRHIVWRGRRYLIGRGGEIL